MSWVRLVLAGLGGVAIALVVFMLLPLLGVNTGIGPFAPHEASPSAAVSPSSVPSASAQSVAPSASEGASGSAAPAATPTPTDEGWICGLRVTLPATGVSVVHTVDVRVGTHGTYDRIVFEYAEAGTPAFMTQHATPPFVKDPSGLPMTVNGSNVLEINLNGATKVADDGSVTYTGPTNFEPGFPQLVQLVERGDFEAVNTWYMGLDGGDCLRAATLTDPSRIVIDVQH